MLLTKSRITTSNLKHNYCAKPFLACVIINLFLSLLFLSFQLGDL